MAKKTAGRRPVRTESGRRVGRLKIRRESHTKKSRKMARISKAFGKVQKVRGADEWECVVRIGGYKTRKSAEHDLERLLNILTTD